MMQKSNKNLIFTLLLIMSLNFLSSCLPEPVSQEPLQDQSNVGGGGEVDEVEQTPQTIEVLPQTVNFIQLGTTETTNSINLNANFTGSFLLRGNNIISYLSQGPNVNHCLVMNFPRSVTNTFDVLVLSAQKRTKLNTATGALEYFLQIEPNNEQLNQTSCLKVSLINSIQTNFNTTSINYKASDFCPNCKNNIRTNDFEIFSNSGARITNIDISHLSVNLLPPEQETDTTNPSVCNENSQCTSIGFNCCLASQCVNHAAVRPNISLESDKYKAAKLIIEGEPSLIREFSDVFYICPEMVPVIPDNNPEDPVDPIQQETDERKKLTDLYQCINLQIDETSICRRDYTEASDHMKTTSFNFSGEEDDLTFSSINNSIATNNIVEINYGGKVFFREKVLDTDTEVALENIYGTLNGSNDNITSAQSASLKIPVLSDAANDTLSVYYRIDGTCEKLGSSLAKCKKFYKQGQQSTPARSSDHITGSQIFALPSYSDLTLNAIVEVGGNRVASGTDTWLISGNNIVFNSSEFPITNNSELVITYYVTDSAKVGALTESKEKAQDEVDSLCGCDPQNTNGKCNLNPEFNNPAQPEVITNFSCTYPEPDVPEPPLQKTVFVSSKTVPHKFYDSSGTYLDQDKLTVDSEQEGVMFEYTDDDLTKPNNLDQFIGFNEIYGTMNKDINSPVPPKVIEVKTGTVYDIFVDEGSFTSCLNCGVDYFSNLQKIFPHNFKFKGGGYSPSLSESRRIDNRSDYPADDFLFGRACFVPASMIPWSHRSNPDIQSQRSQRLLTQHSLFANGYNKDWYGFDYGALIGSFDGITWFAIGSQRKITAKSKKLYLAVNAYFGDLTLPSNFQVTINQEVSIVNSGSNVTHDLESDGAECQKAHICKTDNDCLTQVGYDYACEEVSGITTPWPMTDSNGNELSGSYTTTIASLVGGTNNAPKRCVYRGRGALCNQSNFNTTAETSYAGSLRDKVHTCSTNTTCTDFSQSKFNLKVARFGEAPATQNLASHLTDKSDLFGFGTRFLGRPYDFYGKSQLIPTVQTQLTANLADGICTPDKSPEGSLSNQQAHSNNNNTASADKVLGSGVTYSSNTLQHPNYYATCPAIDDKGAYTNMKDLNFSDSDHASNAIRNSISTNALILPSFDALNLINDDAATVTSVGYQKNSCLRAPGASCFSDFECAANKFIATKVQRVNSFGADINDAEVSFWEEELVCSNGQNRKLAGTNIDNPNYDLNKNRCCRESERDFTYKTQKHEGSSFRVVDGAGTPLIPGVNQDYNDPERYSRSHTTYDKVSTEPTKYPPLVGAASQPTSKLQLNISSIRQYNTLHLNNSRVCCSESWVRNYADGANGNGGGHRHLSSKLQNISIDKFKTLSWNTNNSPIPLNTFPAAVNYDPTKIPFTCTQEDYVTADCEVKNIIAGSTEETKYLQWFGKLELLGIPQVIIKTNTDIFQPLDSTTQLTSVGTPPIPGTIKDVSAGGKADVEYLGKDYYSAASMENFELGSNALKKVFSEDSFNCCLPTGEAVASDTKNSQCCTGQVALLDGVNRCCLNDYTDLSVYTNRYVSSEGKEIGDSDIDPTSGYIKKELVLGMAKTMCCSGEAAFGRVIDDYFIPINYTSAFQDTRTRRWIYNNELDNDPAPGSGISRVDLYNAGVRWNDHVYCIPKQLSDALKR